MKKLFSVLAIGLMLAFGVNAAMACSGSQCFEEAGQTAIATPYFTDDGGAWGNPSNGGWGVLATGQVKVDSYAKGTKSADAIAGATGTGIGFGTAGGVSTPSFGLGASAAHGSVYVAGAGVGVGTDKKFRDTKDYASVGIQYTGYVGQGNGIGVNNTVGGGIGGTGAGGDNHSYVQFSGGSTVEDHGNIWIFDIGVTPAIAINADGGMGYADGYTKAGYISTPNFSAAGAKTFSESGHTGDSGRVWGDGNVSAGTYAVNGNAWGQTSGSAAYCYDGNASYGSGVATTYGVTSIVNTPFSNTVTSFGASSASAGLGN